MPKQWFTPGILALLFTLGCEVSSLAQSRETKPEPATISGIVTLKGEPARGVSVLLQEQQANPFNALRSRTDEKGQFRFTGVAHGKYLIFALAPGFVSVGDSNINRSGQSLIVAEGEKLENISIELTRGGVIAGNINDSQGRPIVDETVRISKLGKDGKIQNDWFQYQSRDMYVTDDRGAFRIFGVPEGRYLVSVGNEERPGSVGVTMRRIFYPRTFYPGVISESEAKVVEVSEGSENTDVDIKLAESKQTCNISGRVIDADTGQPVEGLEVVIGSITPDGQPGGGWASAGARSAKNGEFQLNGALPGRYSLFVRAGTNYSSRGERIEGTGEGFISPQPVIVNAMDDVTGVEIKVRQGGSISGVAIIEGTNDPKILSKLSQVNIYTSVSTGDRRTMVGGSGSSSRLNSDGSFRVRGLQAGKAYISVSGSPNLQGLTLMRIEHNGTTARDGIAIESGQNLTGVRLVLAFGTLKLRGELKVVGSNVPSGVGFRITSRRVDLQVQQNSSAEVDARGQFLIENLLPGEYEIRIFPFFTMNSERLDPQIERQIILTTQRIAVTGDNSQTVILTVDLSRKEDK